MFNLRTYTLVSGAKHTALVRIPERMSKNIKLVMMQDRQLSVFPLPRSELEHMTPLERMGKPYNMARALKGFRLHAKIHGSTKEARDFLTEASNEYRN